MVGNVDPWLGMGETEKDGDSALRELNVWQDMQDNNTRPGKIILLFMGNSNVKHINTFAAGRQTEVGVY